MRTLLSLLLVIAVVGTVALTPSQADAQWVHWGRSYGYYPAYSYSYPAYTTYSYPYASYYYSPGVATYVPGYATSYSYSYPQYYYTPRYTSYYYAPGVYYNPGVYYPAGVYYYP
jgi:hypothetical protein